MAKRRKYSPEFKAQVVLEIISGAKTRAEVAREHRIKTDLITRWRRQFLENAATIFQRGRQRAGEFRDAASLRPVPPAFSVDRAVTRA